MVTKEEFIDGIATDLKPAPSLLSPPLRGALWFYISLALLGGLMYLIQPFREAAFSDLAHPRFLLETLLPVIALVALSSIAFLLATPGVFVSKVWQVLAFAPLVLFVGSVGIGVFVSPSMEPISTGLRASCFGEIMGLSLLPVLFMVLLLRRALVFYKVQTGIYVGFASAAIPTALMQLACMYVPEHTLNHHILPLFIVGGLGGLLGPLLFWRREI